MYGRTEPKESGGSGGKLPKWVIPAAIGGTALLVVIALSITTNKRPVVAAGTLTIMQDGTYLVYPADIMRVLDGDTVDLKFRIWVDLVKEARIRLLGIDAPEVRGEEKPQGLIVAAYLKDRITGRQVYLKTDGKPDKYGRLLGIILVDSDDGKTKIDLNKEMLEKGLVRAYN